jgi:polyferredoxin
MLFERSRWWASDDDLQGCWGFAVQDQIVRQFEEKRKKMERWEKIRWSLDRHEWTALWILLCLFLAWLGLAWLGLVVQQCNAGS